MSKLATDIATLAKHGDAGPKLPLYDKHKAMILAANAGLLNGAFQDGGFYLGTHQQVLDALDEELIIAQRGPLEEDKRFRQIIPYILVQRGTRFLTYVRGDGVGEQRLAGKMALGIGGHVELNDIKNLPTGDGQGVTNQIDLNGTLQKNAGRELNEEIGLPFFGQKVTWRGLIVDHSSPVSRVHVGIVGVVLVTEDIVPDQEEVTNLVWMTQEEIVALPPERQEGWTALVAPKLHQIAF